MLSKTSCRCYPQCNTTKWQFIRLHAASSFTLAVVLPKTCKHTSVCRNWWSYPLNVSVGCMADKTVQLHHYTPYSFSKDAEPTWIFHSVISGPIRCSYTPTPHTHLSYLGHTHISLSPHYILPDINVCSFIPVETFYGLIVTVQICKKTENVSLLKYTSQQKRGKSIYNVFKCVFKSENSL